MSSDRKTKVQKYGELIRKMETVLADESDPVVWMSTLACLIKEEFGFLWVGFYLTRKKELSIGPYQGSLGCLRIPFSRGVCGTCAVRRETVLVPDVHKFPGHIACDHRSNAEIVVPIFDEEANLRAVLDIDSSTPGSFDDVDRESLENIAGRMRGLRWSRLS